MPGVRREGASALAVHEPFEHWPNGCAQLAEAELDAVRTRALRQDQTSPVSPALDLWQELVAGNLSLVDRFDAGGRRYLVARKNTPDVAAQNQLTQREAQVASRVAAGLPTKVIAYELGLQPSTVSTHLDKALSKLGARNAADLTVAWGMAHARRT